MDLRVPLQTARNTRMSFFSLSLLLMTYGFLSKSQAAVECSNTSPCPFKGNGPLKRLPELVSKDGVLNLTLTVEIGKLQTEWLTYYRRTFNGTFPGPTWRVNKGDTVNVRYINKLDSNQPQGVHNQFRLPNTTNLHTHGLHISSASPGDDVFIHIEPGKEFVYTFKIDSENPSGTYWYHPHFHGSTFLQVESGMGGMIIVQDSTSADVTPSQLLGVSCPLNCAHEIALMFQPSLMYIDYDGRGFAKLQKKIGDSSWFRFDRFQLSDGSGTLTDYLTNSKTGIYYFTTNGQLWPHVNISTGTMKRFRMVNAGGSAHLELQITGPNGTQQDGCEFKEIAIDGVYLDKPVKPKLGKSFLVPSARVDWLVNCKLSGTYELRSVNDPNDTMSLANAQRFHGKLLTINVMGSAAVGSVISNDLPKRPSFVSDFRSLNQSEVGGRFVVEVNPSSTLNRLKFNNMENYRFKAEVGTVQEWYFTNTNAKSAHPIHIHINHFQVISYNKYTGPVSKTKSGHQVMFNQNGSRCFYQPANYSPSFEVPFPGLYPQYMGHETRWKNETSGYLGYSREGVFRDVLHIPPMSNITIRFMVHKFSGVAVVHCHILKHEDKGMMMTLEYVKPGTSVKVNNSAGTGHPGQCNRCDPYPFNEVVNCNDRLSPTSIPATSNQGPAVHPEISIETSTGKTQRTTSGSTSVCVTRVGNIFQHIIALTVMLIVW